MVYHYDLQDIYILSSLTISNLLYIYIYIYNHYIYTRTMYDVQCIRTYVRRT